MAETVLKDYVSLRRLTLFKELVDGQITEAVADSIKTVGFDTDTKTLKFYTESTITETSTPVLQITIPDPDLSDVLRQFTTSTEGDVVAVGPNGTIVDSTVKLADLATKTDVAQAAAGHVKKKVVTQEELGALTAETWNVDTIYMVKDDTVTEEDKYKEYVVIENVLTCIGSTSTSLEGLAHEDDLTAATTRITALETKVGDGFREVTEAEIRALWDTTANEPTGGGGENA